jgi:hypothetical protein
MLAEIGSSLKYPDLSTLDRSKLEPFIGLVATHYQSSSKE